MSGHTPGPWDIIPDASNQNDRRITAKGQAHIAKVYGWAELETTNAHLIAAAPDMLAALEMAHIFIADQFVYAEAQALEGEYVSSEARDPWYAICNAIAKAKGETP